MRMRPLDIADALNSLAPGAVWSVENEDYSTLEWQSEDITKPSLEEVEAEIIRLQEQQDLVSYRMDRAAEYPDFRDYIDGVVKGDDRQVQDYIDKCLAVKAKYPKPGE